MNKRDERDTWSIDSEVGPRGGGATSDGKKWVKIHKAAADAIARAANASVRKKGKR